MTKGNKTPLCMSSLVLREENTSSMVSSSLLSFTYLKLTKYHMLSMGVKVNVLHEDQELVGMRKGGVRRIGLMCSTGIQGAQVVSAFWVWSECRSLLPQLIKKNWGWLNHWKQNSSDSQEMVLQSFVKVQSTIKPTTFIDSSEGHNAHAHRCLSMIINVMDKVSCDSLPTKASKCFELKSFE